MDRLLGTRSILDAQGEALFRHCFFPFSSAAARSSRDAVAASLALRPSWVSSCPGRSRSRRLITAASCSTATRVLVSPGTSAPPRTASSAAPPAQARPLAGGSSAAVAWERGPGGDGGGQGPSGLRDPASRERARCTRRPVRDGGGRVRWWGWDEAGAGISRCTQAVHRTRALVLSHIHPQWRHARRHPRKVARYRPNLWNSG